MVARVKVVIFKNRRDLFCLPQSHSILPYSSKITRQKEHQKSDLKKMISPKIDQIGFDAVSQRQYIFFLSLIKIITFSIRKLLTVAFPYK